MCSFVHQRCTSHWVTVLEKAFAATIVVSVVWLAKALLLELLYIKTAIKPIQKRKSFLENAFNSLLLLAATPSVQLKESILRMEENATLWFSKWFSLIFHEPTT
jgi:hypothetical protein